jgi:hypothetical protein
MFKEILEKSNVKGLIDDLVVNKEKVIYHDELKLVLIYLKFNKEVFTDKFAITKIGELLNITKKMDSYEIENLQDEIIFKNKKSKLIWRKAQVDLFEKNVDIDNLLKIFSSNNIEIKLSTDIIELLKETIGTGLDKRVKLYTENKNLYISSSRSDKYKYETILAENIEKNYVGYFNADVLLKLLDTVDYDCNLCLEYNSEANKSLPMLFKGKTKSGIDVIYIFNPLKVEV